jgi:hypothetical protein
MGGRTGARTVVDLRPWPVAWIKWPVLAAALGLLAVADEPAAFAAMVGLGLLVALWVATFRVRVLVDDDSARLRTRARSLDLDALTEVTHSGGVGFPKLHLRAGGRRVGLGGFGRWGPGRWNRLLDALDPYVRRCPDVDASARKLWRIKR